MADVADSINYATGALYAPAGAVTTMVNGGVVTVSNSYNSRVQPIVLSAATTGQTVLSLSYNFHVGNFDNGNIYQIVNNRDNTRTENFTYDNLNRLTQGSSSGTKWGEAFTADPWGNMWQRSQVSGKTNYEPLNAPASLQNQLSGFTYDVAGNMIQNGSATYTYDGENRLTATAGWTYVYDGDSVRVEKKNGSTGTLYWTGTGSAAISESDLAGTDKEEYVFFDAERIARRDVANAVHYYFSDHLGSASIVTNASGGIEDESDYYPYGGEMVITATTPQNYKFTGKERDAESGLDDFGARFHASALGRFMTPDWDAKPVTVPYAKFGDPQTLNLYSYLENAPVNRADADGHQTNHPGACDSNGCASDKELADQTKKLNMGTVGKGAGEVGVGAGLITLAILGAPETGGGSLAALGIFMAVMGGEAEIGKGVIDIANGSGAIDNKTAENGKQGVGLATNPVSAVALPFTGAKTAEQLGNIANGATGLHDLAKRPEGIADGISKVFAAKDVKEGYQSAKELVQHVGSSLMDKAASLYKYF